MEFLFDYLGFLARVLTVVVAIVVVLGFVFSRKPSTASAEGTLEVKHLNRELEDIKLALEGAVVSPEEQELMAKERAAREKKERKAAAKAAKAAQKAEKKAAKKADATAEPDAEPEADPNADTSPGRVYVLNFVGDIQASALDQLRQEVTSVLNRRPAE